MERMCWLHMQRFCGQALVGYSEIIDKTELMKVVVIYYLFWFGFAMSWASCSLGGNASIDKRRVYKFDIKIE